MTTISSTTGSAVQTSFDDAGFDEAQVAAASFLARYSGRTLEAYRQDLRGFFQWAADHDVPVLAATRPQIELWRGSMEERGLAASTIDRRLSTVCGFYRFAHIDGRIGSNPAEYVRRPQVHPSDARGLDRTELGMFLAAADHYDSSHQALAVLLGLNGLRVSEACETNVEDLAVERGHRILRITGKGNKPATIPLVPRTARTIDLVVGQRHEGPILRRRDGQRLDRRTAHRWVRSIGKRAGRTCCERRSSWPPSTPGFRCGTCRRQRGTRTHGPRRSTTGAARTSIATPPTSSWPSSPEADRGRRAYHGGRE
jgi:integrase/recombinase XerD